MGERICPLQPRPEQDPAKKQARIYHQLNNLWKEINPKKDPFQPPKQGFLHQSIDVNNLPPQIKKLINYLAGGTEKEISALLFCHPRKRTYNFSLRWGAGRDQIDTLCIIVDQDPDQERIIREISGFCANPCTHFTGFSAEIRKKLESLNEIASSGAPSLHLAIVEDLVSLFPGPQNPVPGKKHK